MTSKQASLSRLFAAGCIAAAAGAPIAVEASTRSGVGTPGNERVDGFIVGYRTGTTKSSNVHGRMARLNQAGRLSFGPGKRVAITRKRSIATGADVIEVSRKLDRVDAETLMRMIASDPEVAYVEPDLRVHIAQNYNQYNTGDTYYTYQYGLVDGAGGINVGPAWVSGWFGQNIRVAVVDTGILNHPDLEGRTIAGYDFISDTFTANDGGGRDADPTDTGDGYNAGECGAGIPARNSSWHGTHLAGVIGAKTWNAKGIAAVAPGVAIQPIRIMGKCGGKLSDMVDGVIWAAGGAVVGAPINWTPAHVINLSITGASACPTSLYNAIGFASSKGSIVVTAAGNANANTSGYYPASCTGAGVITVAATDTVGKRVTTSNYGTHVAVSAPGWSILSTGNTGTRGPVSNAYLYAANGSSIAAAHVSGVIALVQSKRNPDLNNWDMYWLLRSTTKPFGGGTTPTGMGTGIVEASKAVAAN